MKKHFICANERFNERYNHVATPLFKKVFNWEMDKKDVSIQIATCGIYRLFINGTEITKGYFAPYLSNPDQVVYYDEYLIDEYLKEKDNVLCVLLGNGFNNAIDCGIWDFEKASFRSAPKFALKVMHGNKKFSQCLSMLCKLELHETPDGKFYISRTPKTEYEVLRGEKVLQKSLLVQGKEIIPMSNNKEITLSLKGTKTAIVNFGLAQLKFDFQSGIVITPKGDVFVGNEATMDVFIDQTTVEIFVNNYISVTYTFDTKIADIVIEGDGVEAEMDVYEMQSAWRK